MPTRPRVHIQILDVYPSIRCKVFQSLDIWSQYPFHSLCNGGVALENMSNGATGNEKDGNFVKLLLLNHFHFLMNMNLSKLIR